MAKEYVIGLRDDENILELIVGWLYNSVTMLKATELDILNGWIWTVCEFSLNTAVSIWLYLQRVGWEGRYWWGESKSDGERSREAFWNGHWHLAYGWELHHAEIENGVGGGDPGRGKSLSKVQEARVLDKVQGEAQRKEWLLEERLKGKLAHMEEGPECQTTGCGFSRCKKKPWNFPQLPIFKILASLCTKRMHYEGFSSSHRAPLLTCRAVKFPLELGARRQKG